MKNAFDLVIFDMDGTLLDSMGCLADWIHRAVKEHCPPSLAPADIGAARNAGISGGRAEWGVSGSLPAQPDYRFTAPQEFLDLLESAAA